MPNIACFVGILCSFRGEKTSYLNRLSMWCVLFGFRGIWGIGKRASLPPHNERNVDRCSFPAGSHNYSRSQGI